MTSRSTASLARALATCIALAVTLPLQGQVAAPASARDGWADSARREIEAAVPAGDRARLGAARTLLDRALTALPGDPLLQHYQGYALWREAGLLLGNNERDAARALLEQADRLLEQSGARLRLPETFALRAAVTGQLIGLSRNPLTGMRLGPRSSALMDEAVELGPRNPRVWLIKGINAMYTPAMWGGGLDKAHSHLQRAQELFAEDAPAAPMPAWGEADVHIYLGQIHAKQGRLSEARAAYARALVLQPDNLWVRRVLLPTLGRSPS